MMMVDKRIWVVVVGYHSRKDLKISLSDLNRQTIRPGIIFVDNHSSDGSVEYVRKYFPEIIIVENKTNLGYARASNIGFRLALKEGADFIALVNPDTEIPPEWLKTQRDWARRNPAAGIIGSKVLFASNPEVINSTGISINRLGLSWDTNFGRLDRRDSAAAQEVAAISGCAMFFRAELFKTVGFFDRRLWSFCEDVDFCLRVLEKTSYKIIYLPTAIIRHRFSASFDKKHAFKKFLMCRNSFFIIARHFPRKFLWTSLLRRFQYELADLFFALRARSAGDIVLELKIILSIFLSLPLFLVQRLFENGREKIEPFIINDYEVPHHFPPMNNRLKTDDRNRLLIGINEKFLEDGFYHLEKDIPLYRWIGPRASCYLELPAGKKIFLQLHLGLAEGQPATRGRALINGRQVGDYYLKPGWQTVFLPVAPDAPVARDVLVTLEVEKSFVPGSILDRRRLAVRVNEISLLPADSPFFRQKNMGTADVIIGENEAGLRNGWYGLEENGGYKYRWIGLEAGVQLIRDTTRSGYVEILASVPDNTSRVLEVFSGDQKVGQGILKSGWQIYRFHYMAPEKKTAFTFRINRQIPDNYKEPSDSRELGLMVSRIAWGETTIPEAAG